MGLPAAGREGVQWERSSTVGGSLLWPAFKKSLLGKYWKSSHIVMETPERSLKFTRD